MLSMLMKLEQFKKEVKPCFVAWSSGFVTANDNTYKIVYVENKGKRIPYVELGETRIEPVVESRFQHKIRKIKEFDEEKNIRIRNIISNKFELKYCSYEIENNEYFVIGIGPEAILAYKNQEKELRYFRYEQDEGNELLNKLFYSIEQKTLI